MAAYQIYVDRGPTGGPTSQRFKVWVLLVSAVSHQEQAPMGIMSISRTMMRAVVCGGRNSGIGRTDPDRIFLAAPTNECEHAAGFAAPD